MLHNYESQSSASGLKSGAAATEDKTDLIIALDFPNGERAFSFVEQLTGLQVIYKVGLELFMCGGPELVRELVRRKNRVFLDLKFHDIPNTVARAVKQAALLQVEMMTVHLSGGREMIRAVANELSEVSVAKPKILGVSVLTSFNDERWAELTQALTGHATQASDAVMGLVGSCATSGIDGVVCSALELEVLIQRFPKLFTVVPGIRPAGFKIHDQARVTTPAQARQWGAHAIVMGRPITESQSPREITELVLKDLAQPRKV